MKYNKSIFALCLLNVFSVMYSSGYQSSLARAFLDTSEQNHAYLAQKKLEKEEKIQVVVGKKIIFDDDAIIFYKKCSLYPMKNEFEVEKAAEEEKKRKEADLLEYCVFLQSLGSMEQSVDKNVVNILNSLKN